jgi:LacI family transcriptional regulator
VPHLTASLSDVARAAKTSLATASRVLSGSSHPVSEATRKRVLKKAAELDFTPNALARALSRRTSQVVGVLVGDITDPYFAEIARGVSDVAESRGYLTVVCNGDRHPETELRYVGMLNDHRAAGIMLAGGVIQDKVGITALAQGVKRAIDAGTRVVCLADRGIAGVPVISVDERAVVADLTRHLIRLGHSRIAFVGGPEGLSTSVLRLQGFERAMVDSDLDPTLRFSGGFGVESGRAAATAMLTGLLPDAVVAATDETAVGILLTLRQAGIDVPRQVSVAGVDDSAYAQIMDLSTVKLPTYELGAAGARYILGLDSMGPSQATILPHRVIPRGTTMWIPRSAVDKQGLRVAES